MSESEDTLRKLGCHLGLITRADGSSHFSQGETSVISGMYGPVEVRPHKELPDRITVDITLSPKGSQGVDTRAKEAFLREIVSSAVLSSLYPRANLSLALQVLEDDGGLWAALANAACLALIDSGISMKSLFAAVTCSIIPDENDKSKSTILMDATTKQSRKSVCEILFVFESRKFDLLGSQIIRGSCNEQKFHECIKSAQTASKTIFQFYRETVNRKFSKEIV